MLHQHHDDIEQADSPLRVLWFASAFGRVD